MADREHDVRELEKVIGLPYGFYDRLLEDDDWSFVIKMHALFESVTTHVLARCLGKPALEEPLAHIEMSNKRSGKVAIGKVLGLFDEEERRFLYQLSELRNELVHRVSNVSFTFKKYLETLNIQKKQNFYTAFGFPLKDPLPFDGEVIPRNDFIESNTKTAIWMTAADLLSVLYQHKEIAKHSQNIADLEKRIAADVVKNDVEDLPHEP